MTTRFSFSFLIAACAAGTLWAADGTWTAPDGGDWNTSGNWDGTIIAEGSGSTASFSGTGSVNNNMMGLELLGFVLDGDGLTFTGSLVALGTGGFNVLGGNHTVELPLNISGGTAVTIAPNQDLALNGSISGAGGLTVTGGRLALGAANGFTGPLRHITGLVSFSDPAALGGGDSGAANLILGEGTLRYTGTSSATLERGFTFHPGEAVNRAAVIDVVDSEATLTVAGQVLTDGGAFIKTGEGTLKLAHNGFQELARGRYGNQTGIIEYDDDGIPATNRYASFVVDQGRLILGAPDQDNLLYAGWVGSRNDYSPRLDIVGGRTRFVNDYFTIGRGTGSRDSVQSPSMYVSGGSTVILEGSGFVMDNAQSKDNHFCRPYLSVSGGSLFQVNNHVFLGENPNATSRVDITGGSAFISNHQGADRGMIVSMSENADTTVTFDNASTNSAYLMRVARNGRVAYQGGSLLELDCTTLATSAYHTQGTVTFNGADLRQRTPARSADWFAGHADFLVGDSGLTIRADSYAWLAPAIRPAAGATSASVTKTGLGTLAILPPQVPVTVTEGTLAISGDAPNVNPPASAAVTVLPGAALQVSGANILDAIPLTASTLDLAAQSLTSHPENWYYRDNAQPNRTDGHLRLTHDFGGGRGAAFLSRKRTVTGPWTATFTYRAYARGTTPADGIAFVIHNDPAGNNAIGAAAGSLGYERVGDTAVNPGFTNSVAIGIAGYYKNLLFGKHSAIVSTDTVLPTLGNNGAPHHVTVSYDGDGTLTATVERPDRSFRHTQTYPVNLADEIRSDEAYVGFTGGTGGSTAQNTVSDFTFTQGTAPRAPAPEQFGGAITLGANETLTTRLHPTPAQNGFALRSLDYAAGAALDITAQSPAAAPNTLPAIDLADKGLWKLNGTGCWKNDGSIALNTNAPSGATGGLNYGSAFTTNRYPIAGSWTARIGYRRGLASGNPADFFSFVIQGSGPTQNSDSSGLAVRWHYYDNAIQTTQIKTLVNNASVTRVQDISPINLKLDTNSTFTVAYNAPSKTLTVTTVQGANTHTIDIPDIDPVKILNGTDAYIGFYGQTGGEYAENRVTSISFESESIRPAPGSVPAYLAFDTITGTGPLTITGGGALGLLGNIDRPTDALAVRLEDDSGVFLRKTTLEPLDQNAGPRSDWVFSAVGSWAPSNTMQICDSINNTNGTATSARRVRVTDSWTATFDFVWGSNMNSPADAVCLFLHNDSRGPGFPHGNADGAGFYDMRNSIALRWYFYPGNTSGNKNTVTLGRNGGWDTTNLRFSHEPVHIYSNLVTHVTVRYDANLDTLTSIIHNDPATGIATNTFENVNLRQSVGNNDYAYIGLGGATGGVNAKMRIMDFQFAPDAPADSLAETNSLAVLDVPAGTSGFVTLDSPVPGGTFNIASLTLGEAAALKLSTFNAQPSSLKFAAATLNGSAAFDIDSAVRCEAATVIGSGALTKRGTGTLALTGTADYTGDTRLEAGTLALDAPRLPTAFDLHITSGATLSLAFTGKQYIRALYVDGAQKPGGTYTASPKAPWITGPGTLVVTYPPTSTILILK